MEFLVKTFVDYTYFHLLLNACIIFVCSIPLHNTIPLHQCITINFSYPPYGRLLPCPSENGPPRVEHLVVTKGGPVLEYISNALDLPPL